MHFVPTRVIAGLALLSASSYACAGDEGPRPPSEVRVTEGDGQIAPVGTLLPQPIAIAVLNADGSPAPGIRVEWEEDGDGRFLATDDKTDANGQARARWQLGTSEGERRARAVLPGLDPAVFTAIAEGPDQIPFEQVIPLDIATYDGTRQVVHPDFVAAPAGLFGRPFHLAITPYPYGNPAFENPSFFESTRRSTWSLADGAPNPVVQPQDGYLSDPDVVLVPETGELWMYYRQVTTVNTIHLMRSRDGVTWSEPVTVLRAPNHQVVSPSVIRRAPDDWWMFAVNAGRSGCDAASTSVDVRRSSDGIHWSEPASTAMSLPGFWPWHIDVQWIPTLGVFWAVYNAKNGVGCVTPALYIAESPDGFTWTVVGRPVMTKGVTPTLQDIVYRSTFEYDSRTDAITFWYSGARFDRGRYVWGAAVERRRRSAVFAPTASLVDPSSFSPPPAPLTDWP